MDNFVHLHVHSEFSLLDGACRIKKLIKKVKDLGQNSVAITDHGVMSGVIDFYKEATIQGIKPIIGCEVYIAPRSMTDKVFKIDNHPYHLVLLCKNNEGYKNLIKLSSEGFINGFYSKPRIDKELLEKHHNGIIALSACLAGEIPRYLSSNQYKKAKETALYYKNLFGDGNYYIEIQNHYIKEQIDIIPDLLRLSAETNIPLVATNDAHYIEKSDSKSQHILMCIQTNHTMYENSGLEFSVEEFYIKSRDEMESSFSQFSSHPLIKSAFDNTQIIADKCDVTFDFGHITLPYFHAPDNLTNEQFFLNICNSGLKKRYGNSINDEILKRFNYEIEIIKKMGYIEFYLITYDFVKYSKDNDIPVGPGRGSGAGSLVAYCMGITGVDPIKYNLLFERFLNPERVTMPDFDIDFCYVKRYKVIEYVIKKYGKEKVSQIITFGTLAARGVIRDVGRVMGLPYQIPDKIAKLIPNEINITIDKALLLSPDLKNEYENDKQITQLIDYSKALEGMPRHASTHAAAVVITPENVDSYLPLQKNDESIVTQFAKDNVEELGLLKIDFLGLRTLTVIHDTSLMAIKKDKNFDIEKINYEDKAIYRMLSNGNSNCVFQFESAGMKQVLTQLKPETIEDLIAVISLYRPGPMDSIPTYIKNRHSKNNIKYKHPLLKPILEVTYGCIVYQEQVMEICRNLAGFSYGRADLVRRAMAKKKAYIMENERNNFIYGLKDDNGEIIVPGCIVNDVSEKIANEIYDEMSSFASYAFNKSHAAGYAILAYQTAYLKYYYKKEFMAAILTTYLENTVKVCEYIDECRALKIPVLPPDVNESFEGFVATEKGIRFGLLAIKNIGKGFINDLIAERERGGNFKTLYELCERMFDKDMNKRALEGMIKSGSLDSLKGTNRRQMLAMSETIINSLNIEKKNKSVGQISLFENDVIGNQPDIKIPKLKEFSKDDLLLMEKETTGLYLSGHPLDSFRELSEEISSIKINHLQKDTLYKDGEKIIVLGLISSRQNKITKSGENMAFIQLEDWFSSIEIVVFPKTLSIYSAIINPGDIIIVQGRLSFGNNEEPKIICQDVSKTDGYVLNKSKSHNKNNIPKISKKIYLKLENSKSFVLIEDILLKEKGSQPVYLYYIDEKKYVMTPKSFWINGSKEQLDCLKEILGYENVVEKSINNGNI